MSQRIGDALKQLAEAVPNSGLSADDIERLRLELNKLQGAVSTEETSWKLIQEQTASSSAQIDFTGLSDSFRYYVIVLRNIKPATDAAELWIRMSVDGGATFITTNTYSYRTNYSVDDGVSTGNGASTGDSKIKVTLNTGNASDESQAGEIHLLNLSSTVNRKLVRFFQAVINSSPSLINYEGSGSNSTISIVNAVRLLFSAGNIASGTAALYGVR